MSDATTTRGLALPCPKCGEGEASILFHLHDGETFTCQENECEFTAADVADLIERWRPVLAWVGQMPAARGEAP